uniref:Uncharacterized protein n=1 Tax=Arundo donax TaxID=35708 RepID=A0A0A9ELH6_ARUDO
MKMGRCLPVASNLLVSHLVEKDSTEVIYIPLSRSH